MGSRTVEITPALTILDSDECVAECAGGETRCVGPAGEQLCGEDDSDRCCDGMPVQLIG
ncbi:MAG: hypothetical protein AB7P03_22665 [Kofleriaceae bacterium]